MTFRSIRFRFIKSLTFLALLSGLLIGCTNEKEIEKTVARVLSENPEILTDAIRNNSLAFVEAIQDAAQNAREEMIQQRELDERKKFEDAFENPLAPVIREDEAIRGNPDAPLVLVEYSDFECSFCRRGYMTVMELLNRYEGQIQFIYKHLPLNFHENAMLAAQYYESLRLQSDELAHQFHDQVFEQHERIRNGKSFFDSIAQSIGADMGKLEEKLNSQEVLSRIEEDKREAAQFGMQGTPGFILNGVPVRGAMPADHFVEIINELESRGKVNL